MKGLLLRDTWYYVYIYTVYPPTRWLTSSCQKASRIFWEDNWRRRGSAWSFGGFSHDLSIQNRRAVYTGLWPAPSVALGTAWRLAASELSPVGRPRERLRGFQRVFIPGPMHCKLCQNPGQTGRNSDAVLQHVDKFDIKPKLQRSRYVICDELLAVKLCCYCYITVCTFAVYYPIVLWMFVVVPIEVNYWVCSCCWCWYPP